MKVQKKRGRDTFAKNKKFLIFLSKCFSLFPLKIRKMLFRSTRNFKGICGIALRYILIKSIAKQIGDNVSIHENVYIFAPENLSIGNNVSIHPMCYIDATGGIDIGNNVSIAHASTIMSTSHIFDDTNTPINNQSVTEKPTKLKNDIWIGAKTTILYGVTVETGCIIGSHSLVNKSTPPLSVMGGVPAKVIKERCSNESSGNNTQFMEN